MWHLLIKLPCRDHIYIAFIYLFILFYLFLHIIHWKFYIGKAKAGGLNGP